ALQQCLVGRGPRRGAWRGRGRGGRARAAPVLASAQRQLHGAHRPAPPTQLSLRLRPRLRLRLRSGYSSTERQMDRKNERHALLQKMRNIQLQKEGGGAM
ncbi:Protein of unknown function, partial [Gryllus bimaculatus]